MKIISRINKFREQLAIAIMPEYMRCRIGFAGKVIQRLAEEADINEIVNAILFDRKISVFVDVSKEKDSALPPN